LKCVIAPGLELELVREIEAAVSARSLELTHYATPPIVVEIPIMTPSDDEVLAAVLRRFIAESEHGSQETLVQLIESTSSPFEVVGLVVNGWVSISEAEGEAIRRARPRSAKKSRHSIRPQPPN